MIIDPTLMRQDESNVDSKAQIISWSHRQQEKLFLHMVSFKFFRFSE